MKSIYFVTCIYIALMMTSASADQDSTKIAPHGETHFVLKDNKSTVQIIIETHEIQIGKPSEPKPDVIKTNCTYSEYPCSIVDWVSIAVNGDSLFVPRSTFSDLADLTDAKIMKTKEGWTLTLYGGQVSESYFAKIEFNSSGVQRRYLYSDLSPDSVLQETIYHQVTLGD